MDVDLTWTNTLFITLVTLSVDFITRKLTDFLSARVVFKWDDDQGVGKKLLTS